MSALFTAFLKKPFGGLALLCKRCISKLRCDTVMSITKHSLREGFPQTQSLGPNCIWSSEGQGEAKCHVLHGDNPGMESLNDAGASVCEYMAIQQ